MARSAIQCVKLQLVIFILIVVTIMLSVRVGVYEKANNEIPSMKVVLVSGDSGKNENGHATSSASEKFLPNLGTGDSLTFLTNF